MNITINLENKISNLTLNINKQILFLLKYNNNLNRLQNGETIFLPISTKKNTNIELNLDEVTYIYSLITSVYYDMENNKTTTTKKIIQELLESIEIRKISNTKSDILLKDRNSIAEMNEVLLKENIELKRESEKIQRDVEISHNIAKYENQSNPKDDKNMKLKEYFEKNYKKIGEDKNNKPIYLKEYPSENRFDHQFAIILDKNLSKKECKRKCRNIVQIITGIPQDPTNLELKKSKIKDGELVDSKKGKTYWYVK